VDTFVKKALKTTWKGKRALFSVQIKESLSNFSLMMKTPVEAKIHN